MSKKRAVRRAVTQACARSRQSARRRRTGLLRFALLDRIDADSPEEFRRVLRRYEQGLGDRGRDE
jgi:hypothetical protein